jgi:hypothetical protein
MASRKIALKKFSNECHSSNAMDIILDDQSLSDSIDDDCNSQTGYASWTFSRQLSLLTLILPWLPRRPTKLHNTDDEHMNYREQKSLGFRVRHHRRPRRSHIDSLQNPKSHRLIEKRRRDRLNRSLAELLALIPHKKPEVKLRTTCHWHEDKRVSLSRTNDGLKRSKSSKWQSNTCAL